MPRDRFPSGINGKPPGGAGGLGGLKDGWAPGPFGDLILGPGARSGLDDQSKPNWKVRPA